MIVDIFGKIISINTDNLKIKALLEDELSGYISDMKPTDIDIDINFVQKIKLVEEYNNSPSIHCTAKNTMVMNFSQIKVQFIKEKIVTVNLEMNAHESFIRKFRSIGFRDNINDLATLLHELVFVPLTFFDNSKALIHASSMKDVKNDEVIMFGGTGGAGKTSLELLLCRDLGYSFISDDIAVVTSDKDLYPNLSYPKIYAYNVVENKKLENILFNNKSFLDKFQWKFFRKYKGDSRVRRSISPFEVFQNVQTEPQKIAQYNILYKTNSVDVITIEEVNAEKASSMSLDIIKNEYISVLQHVVWHEYNCKLMNLQPILRSEEIYKNWESTYKHIFKDVRCYLIKIPVNISHKSFLDYMRKKFEY